MKHHRSFRFSSRQRGRVAMASWMPIASLLLAWQLVCVAGLVKPTLLPAPTAVAVRIVSQLQSSEFLFDILQTMIRLASGFAIALVAGTVIGLAMSLKGDQLLMPVVKLLSPVPKIALYPIMVLLLGYGHSSKIALVAADAVFPILLASYHGARSVQPKLLWSARAAGAGPLATTLTVMFPAALPSILTGCRIGLVIACINVFLAEMISSTDGLGHVLVVAARSYQVVEMFVPLVLISAIGLILGALLEALRRLLPATAMA